MAALSLAGMFREHSAIHSDFGRAILNFCLGWDLVKDCQRVKSVKHMATDPKSHERLHVSQRFECDGHKGTLLFLGRLQKSKNPDAVYAGVAWDDATRGKHDGCHEGTRYFACAPGCGSFVHPEKLNIGVSFMSAVRERYCAAVTAADEAERFILAQNRADRPAFVVPVVFVGQDKAQRKISDLAQLPRVSLSQILVNGAGADEAEHAEIGDSFRALKELDLSGNLLPSLTALAAIVRHMPALTELRVNKSVFSDEVGAQDASQAESSASSSAALPWIVALQPSLTRLHTLYLHEVPRAFDYGMVLHYLLDFLAFFFTA